MSQPANSYPSKERVVRNDVLVYAEGDPIPLADADELVAQGHITKAQADALPAQPTADPDLIALGPVPSVNLARFPSKERVVRDDVLVYAEGDDIPLSDVDELKRQGYDVDAPAGDGEAAKPKRTPRKSTSARKRT